MIWFQIETGPEVVTEGRREEEQYVVEFAFSNLEGHCRVYGSGCLFQTASSRIPSQSINVGILIDAWFEHVLVSGYVNSTALNFKIHVHNQYNYREFVH